MGMREVIAKKNNTTISAKEGRKLLSERAAKANRLIAKWKKADFIDVNFEKMNESTAQNNAIWLTTQAKVLKKLSEDQQAKYFNGMTPQNVLKMMYLTMGNVNRGNIFTEFAMQTAHDCVYYVKPFFSKPSTGLNNSDMKNRFNSEEVWKKLYETDELDGNVYDPEGVNGYRRPIYETTEDRMINQLANLTYADGKLSAADEIFGGDGTTANGSKYIDGYVEIVSVDENGALDNDPLAIQDPSSKKFYLTAKGAEAGLKIGAYDGKGNYEVEGFDADKMVAYGRFDQEDDYYGNYMGELELRMSRYSFHPRATTLGMTVTQLSEIVLDTTFDLGASEMLLEYGSDAIKTRMDYRAVKQAYAIAKANGKNFTVEFDAKYSNDGLGAKDSYVDNAQTFSSAIATLGDALYNDIQRGAITRIVCGTAVGTYLMLNAGFSPKGQQDPSGIYKFGELDGVQLFKAPSDIIPTNEALCVFKNQKVENDISIAFGTLIPLASTGMLPRKELFSEAGMASYGDWGVINRKYMGIIRVKGLKQGTGTARAKDGTLKNWDAYEALDAKAQ